MDLGNLGSDISVISLMDLWICYDISERAYLHLLLDYWVTGWFLVLFDIQRWFVFTIRNCCPTLMNILLAVIAKEN